MIDFLGIGAQKAGTTWLYSMLKAHPQISFPGGKEIHFWDGRRGADTCWYRDLFENRDFAIRSGEITPAYAILPTEIIEKIANLNPELRIIYIVRNPIERAWSSALMALHRAEMTLAEASDQWFIDHFNSRGSVLRGSYLQTIENWAQIFGKERLLLFRYEMIAEAPRDVLAQCAAHIGVDPEFYAGVSTARLERRIYAAGTYEASATPMRPVLRQALYQQYAESIIALGRSLNWNLSTWLIEPGAEREQA